MYLYHTSSHIKSHLLVLFIRTFFHMAVCSLPRLCPNTHSVAYGVIAVLFALYAFPGNSGADSGFALGKGLPRISLNCSTFRDPSDKGNVVIDWTQSDRHIFDVYFEIVCQDSDDNASARYYINQFFKSGLIKHDVAQLWPRDQINIYYVTNEPFACIAAWYPSSEIIIPNFGKVGPCFSNCSWEKPTSASSVITTTTTTTTTTTVKVNNSQQPTVKSSTLPGENMNSEEGRTILIASLSVTVVLLVLFVVSALTVCLVIATVKKRNTIQEELAKEQSKYDLEPKDRAVYFVDGDACDRDTIVDTLSEKSIQCAQYKNDNEYDSECSSDRTHKLPERTEPEGESQPFFGYTTLPGNVYHQNDIADECTVSRNVVSETVKDTDLNYQIDDSETLLFPTVDFDSELTEEFSTNTTVTEMNSKNIGYVYLG